MFRFFRSKNLFVNNIFIVGKRTNINLNNISTMSVMNNNSDEYNDISYFSSSRTTDDQNEDRIDIMKLSDNRKLCGVYDGHGSSYVSEYLKNNFLKKFVDTKMPIKLNEAKKICEETQKELIDNDSFMAFTSGSTCIVMLENDKYIQVLNAGDSKAIASFTDNYIQLNQEHNTSNPNEIKRIDNIDDYKKLKIREDPYGVDRIGFLVPTRGFGNTKIYPYFTCEPQLKTIKKNNLEFIVIGTDGFWNYVDDNDVIKFINENKRKNYKKNYLAKMLVEKALINGSNDDVSVIISF